MKISQKFLVWCLVIIFLLSSVAFEPCLSTPLNNVFDTQPIYTPLGVDKYFKRKDKGEIRWYISPFYQQTSTARNGNGVKVAAGNRLGRWNLFGAFYGRNGAPANKLFPAPGGVFTVAPDAVNTQNPNPNYPNLDYLHRVAYNITYQPQGGTTPATPTNFSRYRGGTVLNSSATPPYTDGSQRDLTLEQNFLPNPKNIFPLAPSPSTTTNVAINDNWAYVSAPTEYEKVGVRSQLNFDFGFGLGVAVKGGVVDVKQAFSAFKLERQMRIDAGVTQPNPASTTPPIPPEIPNPVPAPNDALLLYNNFFVQKTINAMAKELGLNLHTYHKTTAEDLHMQLYWHFPIDFEDRAGDVGVTFIPYIALGAWLPVSEEVNQKNPFAVPAGNNGYLGFTADLSFGFDFPVLPNTEHEDRSLQWNFGGGILISAGKDKENVHFPSAGSPETILNPTAGISNFSRVFQSGLIPWKTNIHRSTGLTWYFETSLKAEDFLEGLSAYIDFVYTQHMRDKVTIKEKDATRLKAFSYGKDLFQSWTAWKNQQIDFGLDYRIVDALSIGAAVQAHISGVRVYRSTTLIGSLTLKF